MNELIAHYLVPFRKPEQEKEDWEKALDLVSKRIRDLEHQAEQPNFIRATLLINFGDTEHNTYGFTIKDKESTSNLLLTVLEKLTNRIRELEGK